MKSLRVVLLLATSVLASCVSGQAPISTGFTVQVKGKGIVRLTGWLQLRGEVMLFSSREAMQAKLQYPSCISGVFKDQEEQNLSHFEGERVTLTGELFRFDSLADEDAPLLQRKVLAGSVIPNFCFGENVVLISSIETAR